MPGFLTHYLAGQAVLARGEVEIPDEHARIFNLGTQGADIFFYYAPGFLRSRSKGIGSDIHRADFGPFFMHMARWARQDVIFAYLAGFLAHYAVDVAAHPFVNAFSRCADASGLQQSTAHRHLETTLDVLMLARLTGRRPAEVRQWELIEAPREHRQLAAIPFSEAARKVHGRPLAPRDVFHAMAHMARLTRLLHSPGGRRKRFVAAIEDKTAGARILSAMVHMQEINDGRDYLNLSRTHWNADTTRCEAFPELFDGAVAHAAGLINALDGCRRGILPRRALAERIGNFSLATGEPC